MRFFRSFIILTMVLSFSIPAFAAPRVILDDNILQFDTPPVIEQGITLVPLRKIFESLGAKVSWDAATETITASKESTTVSLTVGKKDALVNSKKVALAVPPKVVEGRTLVPLRFISESMGATVDWDNAQQLVIIKTIKEAEPSPDSQEPIAVQMPTATIHFINVGHADAIYISLPNKVDILIDAGKDSFFRKINTIVSYLQEQGVDDLELVVATAPTVDHIGAMDDVLDYFKADRVIESGRVLPLEDYMEFKKAAILRSSVFETAKSQHFQFGSITYDILNGSQQVSLVGDSFVPSRLVVGNVSFLFSAGEGISSSALAISPATVIQAANHGHSGLLTDKYLAKIQPKVAVVSAGQNLSGDPDKDTLNNLDKISAKVYRTDNDGNIIITTDGKAYAVSTEYSKPEPPKEAPLKPTEYIADLDTNTYHLTTCPLLKGVPDNKLLKFKYTVDAMDSGFVPCKYCFP